MLTVTFGLEGSGNKSTRRPLGKSYSVIPPTVAFFSTPCGSVCAKAETARIVASRNVFICKITRYYNWCAIIPLRYNGLLEPLFGRGMLPTLGQFPVEHIGNFDGHVVHRLHAQHDL